MPMSLPSSATDTVCTRASTLRTDSAAPSPRVSVGQADLQLNDSGQLPGVRSVCSGLDVRLIGGQGSTQTGLSYCWRWFHLTQRGCLWTTSTPAASYAPQAQRGACKGPPARMEFAFECPIVLGMAPTAKAQATESPTRTPEAPAGISPITLAPVPSMQAQLLSAKALAALLRIPSVAAAAAKTGAAGCDQRCAATPSHIAGAIKYQAYLCLCQVWLLYMRLQMVMQHGHMC
jgi:hypothetical protein